MTRTPHLSAALGSVLLLGCSSAAQQPAALDTRNDNCAQCRMMVSDARFAAQVVGPGEEPRFFDDIGCLRTYLRRAEIPDGAVAFVADHRTREFVPAAAAVYVRADNVQTPMGSHLVAFADAASRAAVPDLRGATLSATDVFGPGGPPAGPPEPRR